MAEKFHFTTTQFWASTFLVIIMALFTGLMCGLTPSCVPTVDAKARSLDSSDVQSYRQRRADPKPYEEDLRLPVEIQPYHYILTLTPDLTGTTDEFTGVVDIEVNISAPVSYPRVHIKNMTITAASMQTADGTDIPVISQFEYEPNEFYVLDVGGDVDAGLYVMHFEFKGPLLGHIVGFYKSTYTTPDGEVRSLATSKFQPTDARRAFPCFDEPNMKAAFTTTLVHERKYTALSNMEVEREDDLPGDMRQTRFQKSVPMSSYLACFIVCDFQKRSGLLQSGKKFSVYAPDFQINQTEYSLEIGIRITDYFEKYFGVDYPLPKLDMISIPDFSSGAMEHWGLITFRERYLLFDEKESSASNKQRIASVVSHELAHMWFGNIVTMDWWDDLWLNEGFASYVEYLGVDHVEPDWRMLDQFSVTDLYYVMGLDQIVSSHPIIVDVNHPDEINEVFDSIPYSKGASTIRMLNDFIGEKSFREGLTEYLTLFQFDNAKSSDLWEQLQIAYDRNIGGDIDVQRTMDTWTRQMGFPVVNIENSGGNLHLSQQWFLVDPNANKSATKYVSDYDYTWDIPFTYQFDSESNKTYKWMYYDESTPYDLSMPEGASSYIANVDEMGFYRVNYDEDNWKALSQLLIDDLNKIPPIDRSGLIDDAFNLARAEQLNYSVALDMTLYYINETEYVPWAAGADILSWMAELLQYTDSYKLFRKYVAMQTKPLLTTLGWQDTGSHLDKRLRSNILYLSCSSGDQECLYEASELFTKYLEGEYISPNIRDQVYNFGIEEMGRQDVWDYLWDMYGASTVSSEKTRLLYALSKTQEVWLLSRYLEWAKDEDKIRSQDFFSVITYISYNPVGNPLAWDWVRGNWEWLVTEFGTSNRYLGRLVPSICEFYATEQKLQEMEDFFAKYPDGGAGARGREQALERVRTNINWVEKNEPIIRKWLVANVPE